jgi:hypothetical protein
MVDSGGPPVEQAGPADFTEGKRQDRVFAIEGPNGGAHPFPAALNARDEDQGCVRALSGHHETTEF